MHRIRSATIALVILNALAACAVDAGSTVPASSTVAPTAGATAEATPQGSEAATGSPSPSVSPTGAPDPDAPVGIDWNETATFGDSGLTLVTDVSAWDGGFLAIGHSWIDGYHGGPGAPLVWSSADGASWTAVDADLDTTDVELRGILRLADGRIVLIGEVGARAAATGDGSRIRAAAWVSSDAASWTALDLPFADDSEFGVTVGTGPLGHVVSTVAELWYSADGLEWQRVLDVGGLRHPVAGDEGFVVTALDETGTEATVLASGDGVMWYEATQLPAMLTEFSSLGGDWLSWSYTDAPPTISVFKSADGLDWSRALDVNDLTPPNGPKAGNGMESEITEAKIVGAGGVGVMTLGWNHCCVTPPAGVGVWTSTDGETWSASDLPEGAYVTAIATDGDVVVAAGHLERGARAAFWVADR